MKKQITRRYFLRKSLGTTIGVTSLGSLVERYKINQPKTELQYMQKHTRHLMKKIGTNHIFYRLEKITINDLDKMPKKDLRIAMMGLEHIYESKINCNKKVICC